MSREAAELAREAASVIEKYGHFKGDYGSSVKGFCMYGAIGVAQGNGVVVSRVDGKGDPIIVVFPDVQDPRLQCIANIVRNRLPLLGSDSYHFGFMPGAVEFNDLPETTGKDVQKFLMQIADELEVQ